MRRSLSLSLFLFTALGACQLVAPSHEVPQPFDIGVVHRAVTTDSPEAQLWFDRGLALTYGFNHAEAVKCFQRAAELDPTCAMAEWGQANALGPNYNAPMPAPEASQAAFEAAGRARAKSAGATAVERDLIEALGTRFALPVPADRSALDQAYAQAMKRVHAAHPDDPDVAALTAEALMQLEPWKLWSPEGKASAHQPEIRGILEAAMARWPKHPALCHLYIHAMEAGPEVAQALPAAHRLENLTPGLGHLVHMPSHIYTWTGRYADVIRVNVQAVAVDDNYVAMAGRMNEYTGYRMHNYHFVAYGAMWDGQRALALEYARRQVEEVPFELVQAYPDAFDIYSATPYHVMVRFGMWNELLEEPEPAPELLATRAVWHYARGLALASLDRVAEAEREQQSFRSARAAVPTSRLLFNNSVADVLQVAEKVLAGEIEYRRGATEDAFRLLREAVALDQELNYDEPWGWMEPARHALGALLTEQGRYAEALEVYQRDLQHYPENGWALNGMAECLRGLGRDKEAVAVEARFERAWARADVEIPGSCFCKTRKGPVTTASVTD
jgi:tetratricopeptide (TPR) repeat protein